MHLRVSTSPNLIIYLGATFLLVLFLTGCATKKRTDYQFNPPESEESIDCVNQCSSERNSCHDRSAIRYQRCLIRQRSSTFNNRRLCFRRRGRRRSRISARFGGTSFGCGPTFQTQFCFSEEKFCENSYRSCFQACGGTLEEIKEEVVEEGGI